MAGEDWYDKKQAIEKAEDVRKDELRDQFYKGLPDDTINIPFVGSPPVDEPSSANQTRRRRSQPTTHLYTWAVLLVWAGACGLIYYMEWWPGSNAIPPDYPKALGTLAIAGALTAPKFRRFLIVCTVLAGVFLLGSTFLGSKFREFQLSRMNPIDRKFDACLRSAGSNVPAATACYSTSVAEWKSQVQADNQAILHSLGSSAKKKAAFSKNVQHWKHDQEIDLEAATAKVSKEKFANLLVAREQIRTLRQRDSTLQGYLPKP